MRFFFRCTSSTHPIYIMHVEMTATWSTHISTPPCGVLCPKRLLEGGHELTRVPPHVHHLLRQPKSPPGPFRDEVNVYANVWTEGADRRARHTGASFHTTPST